MELPVRKHNRLAQFDYSSPNGYFITVCTQNRRKILWDAVGAVIDRPQALPLSPYGLLVKEAIVQIPFHYSAVTVDNYVIMPNHIHLLLQIHTDEGGRSMTAPTVSTVVQQLKGKVSRQAGFPLWQKGFYDHIVRSRQDYLDIWNYIDGNPARWAEDELYIP